MIPLMNSLLLAVLMAAAYLVAYHTYGRFLARKIFKIDPSAVCPSESMRDNVDYVPAHRHVLFGHHYTSIAGLGPIVGPAIAIIWGWVPAIVWILIGSIFMGAAHDFGALVVSLRGQGRSIGDLAGDIISPRVRALFMLIIFFGLWLVLAVFALIIAILFNMYPQAVLPVWLEVPIAVCLGWLIYKKGGNINVLGAAAVIIMYATVVLGAYYPLQMPELLGASPRTVWILVLLVYCYIASILPVQTLLQPRDFINAHQLFIALFLLGLGTVLARPPIVAPAVHLDPAGAPPVLPFIFVILACGAVSGFHCLVSSGTTSKQCAKETDAQVIGYGGMLLEGALATLVIIAAGAGLGMKLNTGEGTILTGAAAFQHHYSSWGAASGLGSKLGAFVTGASNLIGSFGVPENVAMTILGVFIVSFAATTLDSATRIQRYVITEMARSWNLKCFTGKHAATFAAVLLAFLLAFSSEQGGLILWPLFGAVNQLLAGLALLVVTIYLVKRQTSPVFTAVPMVFMIVMTAWAMAANLRLFFSGSNWLLFTIGLAILALEIWMAAESAIVLKKHLSASGRPGAAAAK